MRSYTLAVDRERMSVSPSKKVDSFIREERERLKQREREREMKREDYAQKGGFYTKVGKWS